MAGWSALGPVSVTFDVQQEWRLRALRLWVTETMPPLTVEGSTDGRTWLPLGRHDGLNAGEDVHDLEVPFIAETGCRYVRVNFAERARGKRLALVEAEIWGEMRR